MNAKTFHPGRPVAEALGTFAPQSDPAPAKPESPAEHISFGLNLRSIRKERELTQGQVAARLGISQAGYGHLETGHGKPTKERIELLAEIFGIHPFVLVAGTHYESLIAAPADAAELVRRDRVVTRQGPAHPAAAAAIEEVAEVLVQHIDVAIEALDERSNRIGVELAGLEIEKAKCEGFLEGHASAIADPFEGIVLEVPAERPKPAATVKLKVTSLSELYWACQEAAEKLCQCQKAGDGYVGELCVYHAALQNARFP